MASETSTKHGGKKRTVGEASHDNPNSKHDQTTVSDKRVKSDTTHATGSNKFLTGLNIYILTAGIGKVRTDLFKKQVKNNGGNVHELFVDNQTTHIIVDEKMEADRMCRIMKLKTIPKSVTVVKSVWLSRCLKEKKIIGTEEFKLDLSFLSSDDESSVPPTDIKFTPCQEQPSDFEKKNTQNVNNSESEEPQAKIPKHGIMFHSYKKINIKAEPSNYESRDSDSDYVPSGEEEDEAEDPGEGTSTEIEIDRKTLPKGNWVCAQASSVQKVNHNKQITDKLEALAKVYENTNDRWRALGYTKAVAVLKKHPKTISTFEEAKSLPGVGERLATKIWEIIESGELRKLNELSSSEELQSLSLFTNIWGVGAATARLWVQQGLRTLNDVKEKAQLTRHQKIGLKHYDDLLDRMPREEAGKIEAVVKDAVLSINPGMTVQACGSYRRGKLTCGDVDILITHPDGKSHKGIFSPVLQKLHQIGFLTDDLVYQEESGNQKKYMGVCKLAGDNTRHRRLDIIVVPYDEYACALMYFTGSAHFNRSMRNLAGKMGMSLSEHSLNTGVVRRRGEKLNAGTPLPCPTEESVFKHLGLKYRPPHERDH